MKIEINNGDLSLIRTDSILVYDNQSVTLTFDDQYTLVFNFSEDSTIKEQKIDFNPLTAGLEINLINFNNPLGTATGKPLPFATADEKPVYVSFAVYSVGKTKILHYNIYMDR